MSAYSSKDTLERIKRFLSYALSNGTPQSSLRVSAGVGSVLTLINQGDALLRDAKVSWLKIALTYVVPYCVSTYAAVTARQRLERADKTGERA